MLPLQFRAGPSRTVLSPSPADWPVSNRKPTGHWGGSPAQGWPPLTEVRDTSCWPWSSLCGVLNQGWGPETPALSWGCPELGTGRARQAGSSCLPSLLLNQYSSYISHTARMPWMKVGKQIAKGQDVGCDTVPRLSRSCEELWGVLGRACPGLPQTSIRSLHGKRLKEYF